uniref:Uncharacterized protein n=1 Tax=Vespula pensylvanica TaxID=30213 RepID=A0A834P8X2_VESPE|nr:hypothetical protein H0235_005203 [Vespula pensylvanica]
MRNGERTWIASNHSTCSWRWRNREVEDEQDEEDEKDEDEEEEKDVIVVDEVDGHSSPNCCEKSSNLLSSRLPYPPPLPPSPPPLLSPLLSEYIQLLLYFEWTRLFSHFGRTFRVSDQLGSCQDNFGIRAPVGMAWERGSGYRRWTKGGARLFAGSTLFYSFLANEPRTNCKKKARTVIGSVGRWPPYFLLTNGLSRLSSKPPFSVTFSKTERRDEEVKEVKEACDKDGDKRDEKLTLLTRNRAPDKQ